jgi:Zn-dependent membrane protease YugP
VTASLIINRRLDSRLYTKRHLSTRQRLVYQNVFIGIQIALIFLIIGLFLGLNNFLWQIIYFVAVVAFSLFIPFQVLSKRELPTQDDSLEL